MESTHSTTRDPLKAVEDPDQRFMTAVAEWGKQNDHDVEKVLAHLRAKILDKKRVKEQNFINWISTYGQENSYDVADTVAVLRPEDVKRYVSVTLAFVSHERTDRTSKSLLISAPAEIVRARPVGREALTT